MTRSLVILAAALGCVWPVGSARAATPEEIAAARALAASQQIPLREVRTPSRRAGSWVAKPIVPANVKRRPGGEGHIWRAHTETLFNRQAQRLMVLRARRTADGREWLKVRLPIRPNTAAGWIPRDRALLFHTRYRVTVDIGRREVRVYRARKSKGKPVLLKSRRVVVGAPATPTPTGLFAIYETVRQSNPNGILGRWALHLTAHSDVHRNFGGGDGRVAMHGRGGASFAVPLGTAGSNGCIRMGNPFADWLRRHADAGTPVRVRR
jgi:lipoprotein-anchoring transpeptidase ErfK/SrfK